MANPIRGPRKRRTRQHVIADVSVHHVEGLILEEGHTAQRFGSDYGYDLVMHMFDSEGFAEKGSVYFQVKASESLPNIDSNFYFDLDIRDYNLWREEDWPVILVLYAAARKEAFWLAVQEYFNADRTRLPSRVARTVRVHVPANQVLDQQAVSDFRGLKAKYERPRLRIQP